VKKTTDPPRLAIWLLLPRAETVSRRAAELSVDVPTVTVLVITHNHGDHTGGFDCVTTRTGPAYLLGAHCTGIEAVFRIRQAAGLGRQTAVVGAVDSSFTLGAGLDEACARQVTG
jgi:glyoxylase-like metal-dependent hydrolase (beta-lactamase superfamily II)